MQAKLFYRSGSDPKRLSWICNIAIELQHAEIGWIRNSDCLGSTYELLLKPKQIFRSHFVPLIFSASTF